MFRTDPDSGLPIIWHDPVTGLPDLADLEKLENIYQQAQNEIKPFFGSYVAGGPSVIVPISPTWEQWVPAVLVNRAKSVGWHVRKVKRDDGGMVLEMRDRPFEEE